MSATRTAAVIACLLLWSCGQRDTTGPALLEGTAGGDGIRRPAGTPAVPEKEPVAPAIAHFVDIAPEAGLDFRHDNGASGDRYFPETMSGGGLLFDADGDGWLDVYLLDGRPLAGASEGRGANALFLGGPEGSFEDATERMGVGDTGYGFGGVAADLDADGDDDLYVTNYGADVLYRNDATHFVDVTAAAALGDSGWSTSCAVLDYDGDGDLDLYVARYVDYDLLRDRDVGMPYLPVEAAARHTDGPRGYPHPDSFSPQSDLLLRNETAGGSLRFSDVSGPAGVPLDGKGLGVVTGDFDGDGWTDLYVANDAVPNHLLRNLADGRFEEIGAVAGVAYGQDGQAEAGMGVDAADYDGDGRLDLTVTNFQGEPNGLYHNEGAGFFSSHAFASGTGLTTVPALAFGTNFIDVDNDGRLDLFVGNGHVLDNVRLFDASTSYPQRNMLFHNRGPNQYGNTVFVDITELSGPGLQAVQVTRGSAVGDVDNDGDSDLLVVHLGGPVSLLRNELRADPAWMSVSLVGNAGEAYGAVARLYMGKRVLTRQVASGRSYLSQSDPRLLFGLEGAPSIDSLVVTWPGGSRQRFTGLSVRTHHILRRAH